MNGPQRDVGIKNWIRLHPYQALALGYVVFLAFITAVSLVRDSADLANALFSALLYSLVYWLGALFQVRTVRKTKKRLDEHGPSKAYIRYPNSRPGSLSGIWNQGIAAPESGFIRFQPAVYNNLEPSGRATDFMVQEVLPDRRKVSRKERKFLWDSGYEVITLITDAGTVELASSPESLDKLVKVLASDPGVQP